MTVSALLSRSLPRLADRLRVSAVRWGIMLAWLVALVAAAMRANAQPGARDSLKEAQVEVGASISGATSSIGELRSGVRMRLNRAIPSAHTPRISEGRLLETYVGRLIEVRGDSVLLESHNRTRMAIARREVIRADTSAGRKSRLRRALLGLPVGFGVGALMGVAAGGGRFTVPAFVVLMTPPGIIVGALSGGGEKWRRVQLPVSAGTRMNSETEHGFTPRLMNCASPALEVSAGGYRTEFMGSLVAPGEPRLECTTSQQQFDVVLELSP